MKTNLLLTTVTIKSMATTSDGNLYPVGVVELSKSIGLHSTAVFQISFTNKGIFTFANCVKTNSAVVRIQLAIKKKMNVCIRNKLALCIIHQLINRLPLGSGFVAPHSTDKIDNMQYDIVHHAHHHTSKKMSDLPNEIVSLHSLAPNSECTTLA